MVKPKRNNLLAPLLVGGFIFAVKDVVLRFSVTKFTACAFFIEIKSPNQFKNELKFQRKIFW